MPPQPVYILDAVDKGNLIQVEIVLLVCLDGGLVVNGLGRDELVADELGCAEEEW